MRRLMRQIAGGSARGLFVETAVVASFIVFTLAAAALAIWIANI